MKPARDSDPSRPDPKAAGKPSKVRCPHCQTVNQVVIGSPDQVFRCTQCEKDFRLRAKVAPPPPTPVVTRVIPRFPILCRCKAKLMVTYSDFGKVVTCKNCKQSIKIPDWVAETKYTEDEFDDMFSDSELDALSNPSSR